ncbi:MAG: hypothetical protein VXZ53_18815, partial [Planctomycetota bacterium]|nr:hypothetical protein [Planctomycetota bacterium]
EFFYGKFFLHSSLMHLTPGGVFYVNRIMDRRSPYASHFRKPGSGMTFACKKHGLTGTINHHRLHYGNSRPQPRTQPGIAEMS